MTTWVNGARTTSTKYYHFNGQRIAMRQNGDLTYLHGDHLGSASLATTAAGAQLSAQRYLPYGGTRAGFAASAMPTDRQFTGQRRETTLGFYDYNARQYDPVLGRFLQADSIVPQPGNPQSLNRYAYVLNNPLRYTDPTGHFQRAVYDGCDAGFGRPPALPYGRGFRIPNRNGLDTLWYTELQLTENSKSTAAVRPFSVLEGNPMVHPETIRQLRSYPAGDTEAWFLGQGFANFLTPRFWRHWPIDPLSFGDKLTAYAFDLQGVPLSGLASRYDVATVVVGVLRNARYDGDLSYDMFCEFSMEATDLNRYITADLPIANEYQWIRYNPRISADKFWHSNALFVDHAALARRWALDVAIFRTPIEEVLISDGLQTP